MNTITKILFLYLIFSPTLLCSKEKQLDLVYKLQWGNIFIGQAIANWKFRDQEFSMMGESSSSETLNYFFDFKSSVKIQGYKKNNKWLPKKIILSSQSKEGKKFTKVIWGNNFEILETTRIPDINDNKVYPLKRENIINSIDPWSAMLQSLDLINTRKTCQSEYKIYDGRRTANLSFKDLGKKNLKPDRPWSYNGETQICGVISKSTGGHRINSKWRKKNPEYSDIKTFNAEIKPLTFIPVRIEVKTYLGKIIARLDILKSNFY